MDTKIDILLEKLGSKDTAATKARFLDDGDYYARIVREMLDDPGFAALGEQLAAGDTQEAFATAHMLKGAVVNCGVTPLFAAICGIVEALRGEAQDKAALSAQYAAISAEREKALAALGDE